MTTMKYAFLRMYDSFTPEKASDSLWSAIVNEAPSLSLPQRLDRDLPYGLMSTIGSDLVFTQTCGLPLTLKYSKIWQILGTPCYSCDGCDGPLYSSVIVGLKDSVGSSLKDVLKEDKPITLAVNSLDSLSGYLLLVAALAEGLKGVENIEKYISKVVITGGHANSMIAIKEGKATIAAIDCVTFALAQKHYPTATSHLKILGFTPKAPALPYVTDINMPLDQVKLLQGALKAAISDPTTNTELIETRSSNLLGGIYFGYDLSSYQKAIKEIELTATSHCPEILDIPKVVPIITVSTIQEESWFNEDFTLLHYFKTTLCSMFQNIIQNTSGQKEEIEDRLKKLIESDHYSWGADGRMIRSIFPSYDSLKQLITYTDSGPQLSSEPLMFVGFIGSSSDLANKDINFKVRLWKADVLIEKLKDVSLCYISGLRNNERSDWGNLVVFKDDSALNHWSKVPEHNQTVKDIAPLAYVNVRIHRGHLPTGLNTPKFQLLRTLFIDYPNESQSNIIRLPVYWSEFSESFSDRKLRSCGNNHLGQCFTELQKGNVFVQLANK